MLEEIKERKKRTTKKIQSKTKNKERKKSHLLHPIKEMNEKKSKQFKRKMR